MEFRNTFENYGRTLSMDERMKWTEEAVKRPGESQDQSSDALSMDHLTPLFEKLALQHETLIDQNKQIIQLLQKIAVR